MAQATSWKQPFHQIRRFIAKLWLHFFPHLTIIGVTGSYGKTNTTRAIATVLAEKYKTLQTDLDLDTIYNLPITILKLRPGHRNLVLEMGVDHKNEMDYHLAMVKPSIGVVTGINPTHSDPELLGSLQGVIKEKSKLLAALPKNGWAILNWDDSHVRPMVKATQAKVIWYGISPKADPPTGGQVFWAEKIKLDFPGTSFVINHQRQKTEAQTGLIGQHFVHACLAAAAVGRLQGLGWAEIKRGLAKLKPLKGRLSVEKGPRGSTLLDDHLRANPASTLAGLQTLIDLPLRQGFDGELSRTARGKRIAILGEMGELGSLAEKEHRRVGQKLAKFGIDYLISIGPLQKLTADEAIKAGMEKGRVFWAKDIIQAAEILKKILTSGNLLYLKGSLLRHMERILLLLEGKKVGCRLVSCHYYWQCSNCPYLLSGPAGLK